MSAGAERAALFAVARAVMSRAFGVAEESITEASTAADIERWDSLAMVIVAVGLERRLGRTLEAASFVHATSMQDILDKLAAPP